MAQPTIIDIFGVDATYNQVTKKLEIADTALESAGILEADTSTPIRYLAAILINAHSWLSQNQDELVNARSTVQVNSPSLRENVDKVEYVYNMFLYASTIPPLNPNQL